MNSYLDYEGNFFVHDRSHMLEQVVDNYTDCRYRVVADLLTSIFHEPLPKSRPGVTLPSRQTQLAILVDSLQRLSEYKVRFFFVLSWFAFLKYREFSVIHVSVYAVSVIHVLEK